MGLHSFDGQRLQYHCANPECEYHNCSGWEDYLECEHHDSIGFAVVPAEDMKKLLAGKVPDEMLEKIGDTLVMQKSTDGRVEGKTKEISVDHPEIHYTSSGLVALPTCDCGSQTFLKVTFTKRELEAPNIKIVKTDPNDPTRVISVSQHPMVARHQALHEHLQSKATQDEQEPVASEPVVPHVKVRG